MPAKYGTHHTKMLVLLRHDDHAQIIIHTANMIAKDWTNMTNAVWSSPLLPRTPGPAPEITATRDELPMGTGARFKYDMLNYLQAYDKVRKVCGDLRNALKFYDFSCMRAAFIASVPGIHLPHNLSTSCWGWPALKRALKVVPCKAGRSEVVCQVSSIATLGPTDNWLKSAWSSAVSASGSPDTSKPMVKVVFPTADEIRRSLDGYESGGSIHTKIQSTQQQKQLLYLRPIFCHWANDSPQGKGELPLFHRRLNADSYRSPYRREPPRWRSQESSSPH
jgi:hypothetical protein